MISGRKPPWYRSSVVSITAAPEEVSAPSLASRLFTRRTVLSFGLTALIVGVAVWRANIDWSTAWRDIRHADIRWYLAAVVAYYSAFVVRALRWQLLLRNANEHCRFVPLFEILTASFFVNCVVPAKMGDLYRAYLLRMRQQISAMKAFGTIITERFLDLFVLMSLLVLAGGLTFRNRVPHQLVPFAISGGVLCAIGAAAIAIMTLGRGQRILRLFPDPVLQRYENFRTGAVQSMGRWTEVVPLSVLVWVLEGTRLAFIVFALGDGDLLSPPNFLLVALIAALLTTVPFTPGGLGLVEGGMILVLKQVADVGSSQAAAIALLDRSVSYGSLIVIGCVFFALTHVKAARPARTGTLIDSAET